MGIRVAWNAALVNIGAVERNTGCVFHGRKAIPVSNNGGPICGADVSQVAVRIVAEEAQSARSAEMDQVGFGYPSKS